MHEHLPVPLHLPLSDDFPMLPMAPADTNHTGRIWNRIRHLLTAEINRVNGRRSRFTSRYFKYIVRPADLLQRVFMVGWRRRRYLRRAARRILDGRALS